MLVIYCWQLTVNLGEFLESEHIFRKTDNLQTSPRFFKELLEGSRLGLGVEELGNLASNYVLWRRCRTPALSHMDALLCP